MNDQMKTSLNIRNTVTAIYCICNMC